MYKITYRSTRENKTVHFYPRPAAVQKLIHAETAAGRLIQEYTQFSEDYLTKKYVAVWKSKIDHINFNKLPEVQSFISRKKFYEHENNHVTNVIGEEINE